MKKLVRAFDFQRFQQNPRLAAITCPKNALLYILQGNVRALDAVPMEGNVELITLFAQSMNQVPVQGTVPFNIIEP